MKNHYKDLQRGDIFVHREVLNYNNLTPSQYSDYICIVNHNLGDILDFDDLIEIKFTEGRNGCGKDITMNIDENELNAGDASRYQGLNPQFIFKQFLFLSDYNYYDMANDDEIELFKTDIRERFPEYFI